MYVRLSRRCSGRKGEQEKQDQSSKAEKLLDVHVAVYIAPSHRSIRLRWGLTILRVSCLRDKRRALASCRQTRQFTEEQIEASLFFNVEPSFAYQQSAVLAVRWLVSISRV